MADGTIFERKGLQTAAIVTDTFRRAGDAMARVQGFTQYRYAAITHPISSLDQEQIRERARAALPEVLAILGVGPGPEDRR
ncbi:MAG: hypothetical protein NVSMB2_22840 [Chloroflexota bacterium]